MKNSAVHAAICNQFPNTNVSVAFIVSTSTTSETEYEFEVAVINPETDEVRNFIFKCSLTEV
jgi:hypothetical protein